MDTKPTVKTNMLLAVLIDGENVPDYCIREILDEVALYGTPTIKRIYCDMTSQYNQRWQKHLLENAIIPVQAFSYTTGKNSSDSALIIDAMDILYGGYIDGFVIVSSDSDFTRLSTRLRETGKLVLGIGERKTPEPFRVSCDKFIYIENIRQSSAPTRSSQLPADAKTPSPKDISKLILDSISSIADESGYAPLSALGNLLIKKKPDFDSRNYGYKKLAELLAAINDVELDYRKSADPKVNHIYVRAKQH